jgi:hypothetical protein
VHLKERTDQTNVSLQCAPQSIIFLEVNKIFESKFNIYLHVQSTLDNSKLTGLLKNFELPRVRIVE